MLRQFLTSAVLMASLLVAPGCAEETQAGVYVDGQVEMTDNSAFSVTLFHDQGEPSWGMNTFYVRVAMPDRANPNAEGRGIPNLDIDLAAWMNGQDHEMSVDTIVTYEGDGVYRIDGVFLDAAGEWTLDFQIRKGAIAESARFTFLLEA
jgi:hypothetical protein